MSVPSTLNGVPPQAPAARSRRLGPTRVRLLGTIAGIGLAVLGAIIVVALLPPAGSSVAPADTLVAATPAAGGAPAAAPAEGSNGGAAAAAGTSWQRPVVSTDQLLDRIGVRITQVALTGSGGLVDLRIQVVDPDKASAIHGLTYPPALVDATTSIVASNLLMGHSHSDPFKAGITYYYIFENPGNVIKSGNKVSVLLGNTEIDNVPVR